MSVGREKRQRSRATKRQIATVALSQLASRLSCGVTSNVARARLTSRKVQSNPRVNEFCEGGAQAYGWSSSRVRPIGTRHPASLYRRSLRQSRLHVSRENANPRVQLRHRSILGSQMNDRERSCDMSCLLTCYVSAISTYRVFASPCATREYRGIKIVPQL